jgi:hypothetical protein
VGFAHEIYVAASTKNKHSFNIFYFSPFPVYRNTLSNKNWKSWNEIRPFCQHWIQCIGRFCGRIYSTKKVSKNNNSFLIEFIKLNWILYILTTWHFYHSTPNMLYLCCTSLIETVCLYLCVVYFLFVRLFLFIWLKYQILFFNEMCQWRPGMDYHDTETDCFGSV